MLPDGNDPGHLADLDLDLDRAVSYDKDGLGLNK